MKSPSPATGVAPPSDFVTFRSSTRTTDVFAVDVLFDGLLSCGAVTAAVFTITSVPGATPAPTFTTTVIDGAPPTASEASEHETVPFAPTAGVVHDQPAPALSDTKVVFAGSGSLTSTSVAFDGPPFATASEYVRSSPATTGSGVSVFTIDTSTSGVMVVTPQDSSFVSGENVSTTVAQFVTLPTTSGATCATTVIAGAAPTANVGRVQCTFPAGDSEHDQPDPLAETSDRPAGRGSFTATSAAFDGPRFVTASE